jgi:DNA-binding NtrC family response regulator
VPEARCVVLASANGELRRSLRKSLTEMRWQVHEAGGGAEAMSQMELFQPEALLMDHWLPDLEAGEFARQIAAMYPGVDVLWLDGETQPGGVKSPRRNELLHALREAASNEAEASEGQLDQAEFKNSVAGYEDSGIPDAALVKPVENVAVVAPIEGMVGSSAAMRELARLIRLVAPASATVLIEGETGSGKGLSTC